MITNNIIRGLLSAIVLISLYSCSSIDKDKFKNLYLSTNEIEGAIKIGVNYGDYTRLLQKFSSEISLIDTTKLNKEENKLYRLFEKISEVYSHSHIIWKLDTENTFENWSNFPDEYICYWDAPIYKNQRILKSLIFTYGLEIEKANFRKLYSESPRSIDAVNRNKAVSKIWSKSTLIFNDIKKIYND